MKFEGKNAVFELLNSNKTIEKIMVEDKTFDPKLREIVTSARERHLKVEFVSRQALDKLSETGHHQGIIAMGSDFVYSDLSEVLTSAKNSGADMLFVILDNVIDPHNLGSIIRVAECVGATAVIIPKNRSAVVNETVARVSAGAIAHVPVCKVVNLSAAIDELKAAGVWVYAADMDGELIYNTNLTGNVGIVVGAEGEGVSRLVKSKCDGVVKLPMFGKVNSLNASVSCGVVLYEVVRQRLNKK